MKEPSLSSKLERWLFHGNVHGLSLIHISAREWEKVILKQLEEKEPLPDKEADQMAWVRAANQHKAIVEEIILKELIYV